MVGRHILVVSVAMVMLFLVAVAPSRTTGMVAEPSLIATPATPLLQLSPSVEAMLTNCPFPTGSMIPDDASAVAPWGLGSSSAWMVGWGNPPRGAEILGTPVAAGIGVRYMGPALVGPKSLGWMMKVLWIIDGDSTEPFTLRGSRQGDGAPIWFAINQEEPVEAPMLDPRHPAIPDSSGGWAQFPSTVYFPGTGCYRLVAEWDGGGWEVLIPIVSPEDDSSAATPAGVPRG